MTRLKHEEMIQSHTSSFLKCAIAAATLILPQLHEAQAQITVYSGGEIVYQQSFGTPDSATFTYEAHDDFKPSQEYDPTSVGGRIADESEAVDLGLSVKWAPWNVGATQEGEAGAYFAWGEVIAGKWSYDWSTYWWMRDGKSQIEYIIKYQCEDINYGLDALWYDGTGKFIGDNKITLDKSDDAAAVNWGGKWRMPTEDEVLELGEKCTWTYKEKGEYAEQAGFIVTGPNGNFIFFPAAGYWKGSELTDVNTYGCYWASEVRMGFTDYGNNFYIYVNGSNSKFNTDCSKQRYQGMSVRAVLSATE